MAIRNIVKEGDPILNKVCRPVTNFDDRLATLLDDMRETLEKVDGCGCAAVHIGVLRRAVVVNGEGGVIELINPAVTEASAQTQQVMEGSIAPGAPRAVLTRPKSVTVLALDRNGNPVTVSGSGFLAATLCHEIDHLDGILFTDKAREKGSRG